jgi:hypothetical protein
MNNREQAVADALKRVRETTSKEGRTPTEFEYEAAIRSVDKALEKKTPKKEEEPTDDRADTFRHWITGFMDGNRYWLKDLKESPGGFDAAYLAQHLDDDPYHGIDCHKAIRELQEATTLIKSVMAEGKPGAGIVLSPVEEIRQLHFEICEGVRTDIRKADRIGELLVGIKDGLNHGEWLPWVKANVPFDRRTASNYMRVHENRSKWETISHLGLTEVYELLQERTDSEPENPEPETGERLAIESDKTFIDRESEDSPPAAPSVASEADEVIGPVPHWEQPRPIVSSVAEDRREPEPRQSSESQAVPAPDPKPDAEPPEPVAELAQLRVMRRTAGTVEPTMITAQITHVEPAQKMIEVTTATSPTGGSVRIVGGPWNGHLESEEEAFERYREEFASYLKSYLQRARLDLDFAGFERLRELIAREAAAAQYQEGLRSASFP